MSLTREEKIKDIICNKSSKYRSEKELKEDALRHLLKEVIFYSCFCSNRGDSKDLKVMYDYLGIMWNANLSFVENIVNCIKTLISKGVNLLHEIPYKPNENILDYSILENAHPSVVRVLLEAGVIPKNPYNLFIYLVKRTIPVVLKFHSEALAVCYTLFIAQQDELRAAVDLNHHLRLSEDSYQVLLNKFSMFNVYSNDKPCNPTLFNNIEEGMNNFPNDLVKLIASYDNRNHVIPFESPSRLRFFSPKIIGGSAVFGGLVAGVPGAMIGASLSAAISYLVRKDEDKIQLYKINR